MRLTDKIYITKSGKYWSLTIYRGCKLMKNMTQYDNIFVMIWHFIYEYSWLEKLIEKHYKEEIK